MGSSFVLIMDSLVKDLYKDGITLHNTRVVVDSIEVVSSLRLPLFVRSPTMLRGRRQVVTALFIRYEDNLHG